MTFNLAFLNKIKNKVTLLFNENGMLVSNSEADSIVVNLSKYYNKEKMIRQGFDGTMPVSVACA